MFFNRLKGWCKSLVSSEQASILHGRAMDPKVKAIIKELTLLTNAKGQPNINSLWAALKDIEILHLNVKNFGYDIARRLQPVLAGVDYSQEPKPYNLVSKPTTQADIESPWFAYWCSEIKAAPIYHRKLWEFAFFLQVIFEHNLLKTGSTGIGFGCGQEPLASYFASKGLLVTVTDLAPEQVMGLGWAETGQHTTAKEQAFYADIVAKEVFDTHVRHQYIDMNSIPEMHEGFDFCWSICALEHLGSIKQGFDFVENSLSVLKPGGIAVHTTEYNYLSDEKTIDNWPTVLFLQKHFNELAQGLASKGHQMLGPDFEVGNGVLDRYIDVPPYALGEGWLLQDQWSDNNQAAHLKLAIDGFACTCYGIIVRKAS